MEIAKLDKLVREACVVVVVPVFERAECINHLLRGLSQQTIRPRTVVVVDHGICAVSIDRVQEFETVVLRRSPSLWFTGALNEGLRWIEERKTQFTHVVVANDDAGVEDPQLLTKLLAEQLRTTGGRCLVSCMALDPAGTVIYGGLQWQLLLARLVVLHRGMRPADIGGESERCSVLPTRFLLMPLSALKEVGLPDETRLPHYGSDYEWTARAYRSGYALKMLKETYIRTGESGGAGTASGWRCYPRPRWSSFLAVQRDIRRQGSIATMCNVARSAFAWPYRGYFVIIGVVRKLTGFLWFNVICPADSISPSTQK